MTTDNLLLTAAQAIQPTGSTPTAGIGESAAANDNPAAFLQALLAQLQNLQGTAEATATPQPAQAATVPTAAEPSGSDGPTDLLAQLKQFVESGLSGFRPADQNPAATPEVGKSLPAATQQTGNTDALPESAKAADNAAPLDLLAGLRQFVESAIPNLQPADQSPAATPVTDKPLPDANADALPTSAEPAHNAAPSDLLVGLRQFVESAIPNLQPADQSPATTPVTDKPLPDARRKLGNADTLPTSAEPWLAYLAQILGPQISSPAIASAEKAGAAPAPASPEQAGTNYQNKLIQLLQAADMNPPAATAFPNSDAMPPSATPAAAPSSRELAALLNFNPVPAAADEDNTPAPSAPSAPSAGQPPSASLTRDINRTLTLMERVGAGREDIAVPSTDAKTEALAAASLSRDGVPTDPPPTQEMATANLTAQLPLPQPGGTAATPQPAPVQTPLNHPAWPQELGDRIVWMAGQRQGLQTANINLNPTHLGPLEIRVDISQDQASIQFVSNHAAVREALDSAIPKLREMLQTQNLNLVDVNVSQHSHQGDQRNESAAQFNFGRQSLPSGGSPGNLPDAGLPVETAVETKLSRDSGLLSLYA